MMIGQYVLQVNSDSVSSRLIEEHNRKTVTKLGSRSLLVQSDRRLHNRHVKSIVCILTRALFMKIVLLGLLFSDSICTQ